MCQAQGAIACPARLKSGAGVVDHIHAVVTWVTADLLPVVAVRTGTSAEIRCRRIELAHAVVTTEGRIHVCNDRCRVIQEVDVAVVRLQSSVAYGDIVQG